MSSFFVERLQKNRDQGFKVILPKSSHMMILLAITAIGSGCRSSGNLFVSSDASSMGGGGGGATPASVSASSSAVHFGNVTSTTTLTKTITFTNSGGSTTNISFTGPSGTFSSTGTCTSTTSLAAGASCTAIYAFTPTSNISFSGTSSLVYNNGTANVTVPVTLDGTGASGAILSFLPSSTFHFGRKATSSSTTLTFSAKNTGSASATSLALSGLSGAFSSSSGTCGTSLAAASTCTYTVTFAPTSAGAQTGTLGFTYNDGNNSVTSSMGFDGTAISSPKYFLYAITGGATTISIFQINSGTGQLTSLGTVATGNGPGALAVDPTHSYLYLTNQTDSTIQTYSISSTSPYLTSMGTVNTSISNPYQIVMHPSGKALYAIAFNLSTGIQGFNIGSGGGLTSMGSAYPTTSSSIGKIIMDVSGKYIFYPDGANSSNNMAVRPINSDYTLGSSASYTPVTTPLGAGFVTTEPSGRYLFMAQGQVGNYINSYPISFDGTLGTGASTSSTGTYPNGLAVDPQGKSLFVCDSSNGNHLWSFTINSTTGALANFTSYAGPGSSNMCITDPTGSYLYNGGSTGGISGYVITPGVASSVGTTTPSSPYTAGSSTVGSMITVTLQ